jgi:CBS domain-containing protein
MSKLVHEIMNGEVLRFHEEETASDALGYLVALGVSGAPVLDDDDRAIGVVSWRDLVEAGVATVRERMKAPAIVVRPDDTITHAADLLARHAVHRVFVVDRDHAVVGALSVVDVLRAMVGTPVRHPDAFPHLDPSHHLTWTDSESFDLAALDAAPSGPGVLAIVKSVPGEPDTVVMVESASDVRARLSDLLASPPADRSDLAAAFAHPATLRFRAAAVDDPRKRAAVMRTLRARGARDVRAANLR